MVRVVASDRKGRIGVETQVTINSKQVMLASSLRSLDCSTHSLCCGGPLGVIPN